MYLEPSLFTFVKTFLLITRHRYPYFLLLISYIVFVTSCTTVGVFEKNISIPGHSWNAEFKPEISFEIQDTTSLYNLYIVVRHTDAYRYNNIWVNVQTTYPAGNVTNQPLDLVLATDAKGWLGSGMDDIFEHRIPITPPQSPVRLQAGTYKYKLENIMREQPLEHVMNVGIRLEKAK